MSIKGPKGKLIIRHHRHGDKTNDMCTSGKMVYLQIMHGNGNFFVAVRRGIKTQNVLVAGKTKLEIKRQFLDDFKKVQHLFKLRKHK